MRHPTFLLAVLMFAALPHTAAQQPYKSITDFGVRVERGQPVYPLPGNVALGLYDPDPLPDLAYYSDGTVQVWRNMGNGTFGSEPVYERRVAGDVQKMHWQKSNMFNAMIYDHTSWGDLYITYADGRTEKISHHQMQAARRSFASLPQMNTSLPPLSFREVWRSRVQEQPVTALLIDDIDNDGRIEVVYYYYTLGSQGDTNRLVIYEHVGANNYVVDWDTLLRNGGGWPLCVSDLDRNGKKEIVIFSSVNPGLAFLECSGPRQYRLGESNIIFTIPGYTFKAIETDVDHDGRKELCVLHSEPQPPPGLESTFIYVMEYSSRGADGSFGFNGEIARYYGFTFDLAVGQMDGTGTEELVPAGGSFGVNEPVPVEYLWRSPAGNWRVRSVYTGLQSGTGAVMFVNTDADTTKEFFSGAPGPIGHGSAFLIDHVSDTTWRVVFADSSLRNAPLWVNAGMLDGQFVVAGANTWDVSQLDTTYSDLHAYLPQGQKLGTWRLDSAYINNFYFLDIDRDHRTNLLFAWTSFLPAIMFRHHAADYESDFVTGVGNGQSTALEFRLEQNYPNPFNPATHIPFSLPARQAGVRGSGLPAGQAGFVSLKVYDVLGREVATLVNGELKPGSYVVTWDASGFAGGAYLYTLRTSTQQLTRKMLLVR